jgi:hypothetical protein
VLRRIQKTDRRHKLLNPWEGPFIVAKVTGRGTYELITEDGIEIHGTSASYEDSTPKKHRTDSSTAIKHYVIKIYDQSNKDNVSHQHLSY